MRQQHLDRLGADASADQSAPIFRCRIHVGVQVVHLRDVAARALQEDDHALVAHGAADRLFHVVDPVGGDAARVAGGVAGVVDHAAEAFSLLAPDADHADLGIDRSGRLDDVGIELAGMGERQSVLHAEAAVEGRLVFDPLADAAAGFRSRLVGRADGFDELLSRPVSGTWGRHRTTFRRPATLPAASHGHIRRAGSCRSDPTNANAMRR